MENSVFSGSTEIWWLSKTKFSIFEFPRPEAMFIFQDCLIMTGCVVTLVTSSIIFCASTTVIRWDTLKETATNIYHSLHVSMQVFISEILNQCYNFWSKTKQLSSSVHRPDSPDNLVQHHHICLGNLRKTSWIKNQFFVVSCLLQSKWRFFNIFLQRDAYQHHHVVWVWCYHHWW